MHYILLGAGWLFLITGIIASIKESRWKKQLLIVGECFCVMAIVASIAYVGGLGEFFRILSNMFA